MINHMMNSNMISMMTMKENISIYHILTTLLVMNITPYLPVIKTLVSIY